MLSEPLIEATVRHQVMLERLKSGQVIRFEKFLKLIDRSIRKRLSGGELTDFTRRRLQRLLISVDGDLKNIWSSHFVDLNDQMRQIAQAEMEFEVENLSNILTGGFEASVPSARQAIAAVFAAPLSVRGPGGGKLLKPFYKDWSASERKRIIGAIRQGAFEGQTNAAIVRVVRGTRANRFTDSILKTTTRNAEAIVRTSVQHVSSIARAQTWEENAELVTGYRWVATLDSRTTQICRTLDGKIFKTGEGPLPPIHVRCRSTVVGILNGNFSFLSEDATRAATGGPVNADLSYYEWLKKQPKQFQIDALGPGRAKLFRGGGLSAERFSELNLNRDFKPLTLAEMKAKEPTAFMKAFGDS